MMKKYKIPVVIGVGSPRAGTTWLYKTLLNHPQICEPKNIKEINYWSSKYDKGEKWYFNHFLIKDKHKYLLDISTNYLSFKETPERINKDLEDYFIIINLRNPYERIISMYNYKNMVGTKKLNKNDIFLNLWIRKEVTIIENINRYLKLLKKDKIIFINFEEIKSNPLNTINTLCNKLKINEMNTLPVKEKIHKSKNPRLLIINNMAFKLQSLLRHKFELNFIAEKLKYSKVINYLLFKRNGFINDSIKVSIINNKNYEEWFDILDNETNQLEKIIGKNLSHWKSNYFFK